MRCNIVKYLYLSCLLINLYFNTMCAISIGDRQVSFEFLVKVLVLRIVEIFCHEHLAAQGIVRLAKSFSERRTFLFVPCGKNYTVFDIQICRVFLKKFCCSLQNLRFYLQRCP